LVQYCDWLMKLSRFKEYRHLFDTAKPTNK